MPETKLIWHEGQRYTGVDSQGATIAIGGEDGAKPSDLLPISLAACTAYTLIDVLRKKRQVVEGLESIVSYVQAEDAPWAFTSMDVLFRLKGQIEPAAAERALSLAHEKYCSVAATLSPDLDATFRFEIAAGP